MSLLSLSGKPNEADEGFNLPRTVMIGTLPVPRLELKSLVSGSRISLPLLSGYN